MITQFIKGVLPNSSMLIATIGFFPEDEVGDLGLPEPAEVVDLDDVDLATVLDDPASGVVGIIARTSTDLRRAASLAAILPKAKHLVVAVVQSPPHRPLALPAVSPDWRSLREFRAHRGGKGDWAVDARFTRAIPVGEFVATMTRGFGGHRPEAPPPSRVALAGPGAAHWRPGDSGVVPTDEAGPLGKQARFLPADLVLRLTGQESAQWRDPRAAVVDRPRADRVTWNRLGAAGGTSEAESIMPLLAQVDAVPPVDERSVNPTGFISTPELGMGSLTQTGGCWSAQADQRPPVRFHPSGAVTDADVAGLRQLRALKIDWGRHAGPVAAVRVLAGLAAAGVPLYASHIPVWTQALGPEIANLITSVGEHDLVDDLSREEYSIRLRRAALRAHSAQARWRHLATAAGLPVAEPPQVSVILCTRRPDFLDFALRQIARQRNVRLELVLTLHGIAADRPEVKAAVADFRHPITVVEVPADTPFGVALNSGVARASGRYLAKWDDDDWYGPEHLSDMLLAFSYSGADLVGCLSQLVYLEQIDLTVLCPGGASERVSRYISGGTLVMERHIFDAVGGFRPMPRHVDTGLLRAIEAMGGRIYRTHGLGYLLHRRAGGHTWTEPVTHFLRRSTRQWRGFRPSELVAADDVRESAIFARGGAVEDE
ncbi:MAG: glycosyltransferase family 2 protein [Actinomadura sp.]